MAWMEAAPESKRRIVAVDLGAIREMLFGGPFRRQSGCRVPGGEVIGVVNVAGPLVRFSAERKLANGLPLLTTARNVALASGSSAFFKRALSTRGG